MKLDMIMLGAARGARLQRKHFKDADWMPWENTDRIATQTADTDFTWRIHPDDLHLTNLKSLYEVTGDIKDINTLLLPITS